MACCCPGTDHDCCCFPAALNYLVTFSGVIESNGNLGTGTGTSLDDLIGCFLANRPFCLCFQSCDLYVGGTDLLEGFIDDGCVRTFNAFRVTLVFDCDAPQPGGGLGTGSGTGTVSESGVVRLTIGGVCIAGNISEEVPLATYIKSRDSWHCEAAENTMSLSTYDSTLCINWPTTITVTKDSTGIACRCECGTAGITGIGQNLVYEVVMGDVTSGSCPGGDCGCDIPAVRICMKDTGACTWLGLWDGPIPLINDPIHVGTDGEQFFIQDCFVGNPVFPINSTTFVPNYAVLLYYPQTDKMYFGWRENPDNLDVTSLPLGNDTGWIAKYSIPANSFSIFGSNTFTYEGGSYDKCSLPSTIQVNYYGQHNSLCDDNVVFDCDYCESGKTWPQAWTFNLSGITGPNKSVPADPSAFGNTGCDGGFGDPSCECLANICDQLNGDFCLAQDSLCIYSTANGTFPTSSFYRESTTGEICIYPIPGNFPIVGETFAAASLSVNSGTIYLQISIFEFFGPSAEGLVVANNNWFVPPYPSNLPRTTGFTSSGQCTWTYVIGADEFDCEGSNTLRLLCQGEEFQGSDQCLGYPYVNLPCGCDCEGMPSTIVISPSTACGTPTACTCLPKSSYSPVLKVTNIRANGCNDCSCIGTLLLCFTPSGSPSDCEWTATFTLSNDDPRACIDAALTATLKIGMEPNPGFVVVTIYDGSSNVLAEFQNDLAELLCTDHDFLLNNTTNSDSQCNWSLANATLDMNRTCVTCNPCEAIAPLSGDLSWTFSFSYGGNLHQLCFNIPLGQCSLQSSVLVQGTSSAIHGILEFGESPEAYARVLIYYRGPGTGTGTVGTGPDVLIGVYNFLSDIDTFSCGGPNDLFLATGNLENCGEDIDVYILTSGLGSSGTLHFDFCPICDTAAIPEYVTATWVDNNGLRCCGNGTSATLRFIGGSWVGTIVCPDTGETIDVEMFQTGDTCSDVRLAVTPDSCDPGVSSKAPYSCVCRLIKFKVTGEVGVIPEDEIWITW